MDLSKQKPIFFTSDLHINHKNVMALDNRPFKDIDDMFDGLVKRFNSVLSNNSVLYILGDVGMGSGDHIARFLKSIKGTKVLILGNHDKPMFGSYNQGFDVVLNNASFYIGDELVTMSHCPIQGLYREDTSTFGKYAGENWHGESKNYKFSVPDLGQYHLHGHIHSPNSGKSQRIEGRQMDVGVPANNYLPVSYKQAPDLNYCKKIGGLGTITNPYVIGMVGNTNSPWKVGGLVGKDSVCGNIGGVIATYEFNKNWELVVGGYNTNYKKFINRGFEPVTIGKTITPVVGLNHRLYLNKNISLNTTISLGIITHGLRFDF